MTEDRLMDLLTEAVAHPDKPFWDVVHQGTLSAIGRELDALEREERYLLGKAGTERRLRRERLLDSLHGIYGPYHYQRPCAACGKTAQRLVCSECSIGTPGLTPWRIKPEAAERIREKLRTRNTSPLPLP